MKKRAAIVASIAVASLLAVYLWGPSSVPSGQEPLTELSTANLSDFAAAFDADSDAPRMVLLLSPT